MADSSSFMCEVPSTRKFQRIGGNLALDFTNTVGGKRGVKTHEMLHGYSDFLSWCHQAGVLNAAETRRLASAAEQAPAEAQASLSQARDFREVLYRLFAAVIEGKSPNGRDLDRLNAELARALPRRRVAAEHEGFGWEWIETGGGLGHPLGPVAGAAAELLTDAAELQHVRRCGGENCGWLFLDSSKNHSRRWCDMRDCGNRAKVRRHRMRHKTC